MGLHDIRESDDYNWQNQIYSHLVPLFSSTFVMEYYLDLEPDESEIISRIKEKISVRSPRYQDYHPRESTFSRRASKTPISAIVSRRKGGISQQRQAPPIKRYTVHSAAKSIINRTHSTHNKVNRENEEDPLTWLESVQQLLGSDKNNEPQQSYVPSIRSYLGNASRCKEGDKLNKLRKATEHMLEAEREKQKRTTEKMKRLMNEYRRVQEERNEAIRGVSCLEKVCKDLKAQSTMDECDGDNVTQDKPSGETTKYGSPSPTNSYSCSSTKKESRLGEAVRAIKKSVSRKNNRKQRAGELSKADMERMKQHFGETSKPHERA